MLSSSKRFLFFLLLLTFFIAPLAFAEPATNNRSTPLVINNCGLSLTYKKIPSRSVTMNQSATEVMLLLGLEKHMVGTAYLDDQILPEFEKAYLSIPVIAKKYPSQEVLFHVEPDFVYGGFISAFSKKAAGSREDLEQLDVKSYICPAVCKTKSNPEAAVTMEDIYQEIREIGSIFANSEKAVQVVWEMENKLKVVKNKIGPVDRPLSIFWYDSGDKTPYVGTGTGMPNFLIESVKAKNIFKDVTGGWKKVNWEDVIAKNPDFIVLIQADWSSAQEKKEYLRSTPALMDLSAVQNNRFAIIDFSYTTPGIRNVDGVEILARQLYPEKF